MPIYEVTGPDGRVAEVTAPEGATQDQAIAYAAANWADIVANAPQPKTGLLAALGKGTENTLSQLHSGVAGIFNPEEAAQAGVARGDALDKKYADQTSWQKVKDAYDKDGVLSAAGEVASQVPYALAEQAPNLAAMAGGARLGAMAGAPLGPWGALIGGGLGALGVSGLQQYGGNIERQAKVQADKKQPVNIDVPSAASAAAAQGALDVAGSFIPLGGKLVSKLTGIPLEKLLSKGAGEAAKLADEKLLSTVTKGLATGVAAEVPTEVAQQVLERAQAGLSLTDEDAMREYGQTAYQVGLLAPLGVAGRATEKAGARREVAGQKAAAAAAEQAKADAEANKPPLQLENKPDPMISFPDGTVARQSEVEQYIKSLPEDQQVAVRARMMGLAPQPAPEEKAPAPLALENKPEPMISFPDGSVARKGEAEAYIASLPEDQQTAARAKMIGLGPQAAPAEAPVDEATKAHAAAAADLEDFRNFMESERRNKEVMQAQIEQDKLKQKQLDALHDESAQTLGRTLDQRVAVKNAATMEAPNAMQLALQRAKDNVFLTPAKAHDVAQAPEAQQAKPQEQAPVAAAERIASQPLDKAAYARAATENVAPKSGQEIDAVRRVADALKANWENAPEVVIAKNMDDPAIPEAVRQDNRAQQEAGAAPSEGFFHDGKVYLLADHLPTSADTARVLMHETLGHVGLRGQFGESFRPILDQVIQARGAEVQALAKQYALDPKNRDHLREAAEEVLAAMAEKAPQAGLVKRAVGAVRAWLREHIPGFNALRLSDNDIITQYILPARGFIQRGKRAESSNKTAKPVAMYSRQAQNGAGEGENNGQDNDGRGLFVRHGSERTQQELPTTLGGKPAAQGWASATRISGKAGVATVYRGAKSALDASHFQDESLGHASGNPSSGLGVWFTTGKEEAATYGDAQPYHLDIRNPKLIRFDELPGFDSKEEAVAYRKKLQAEGYDGIILGGKSLGKLEKHVVAFSPDQVIPKAQPKEDIRYSRSKIIGESKRTYSPEQEALFKRTGRTVDIPTMKERVAGWRQDFVKKTTQAIADQFAPVKDLTKHGYTLLRLSRGSAGAIEAFLNHGKLKISDGAYDADMSGGAIDKVFKPLQGEGDDFLWWVAANRAEHLSKEDREHLFTAADIQAGKSLADGKTAFDFTLSNGAKTRDRAAIYADTLKKFDGFNKNALDMAEQSGLIDKDSRKYWEQEFYVPFYRADSDEGTFAGANIKQGAVRQVAFKTLKGGSNKLHSDLLTNTLQNWGHLIDASAKNRAAKAVLDAAEKQGIATSADEATVKAISKAGDGKPVWIMDNGAKRHYAVGDNYIATALQALEYAGMKGPLWKALAKPKHWLTMGVTASPGFKIRNLIRDSVQAMSVSDLSLNPIKNIQQGIKASAHDSQTYVSALASGGLIRFGTMLEGNASDRVRQLIKMGVDKSTILDSEDKVAHMRNRAEQMLMWYNELGNRGEEINRAALYEQLIKKGVPHAEASLAARDLLDFSMQGSAEFVRVLTQVVPFMNARIQGLYKLGRAAKQDPTRFSTVLLATAATSLYLLAQNHDDEDYKKLDDWQRDNFWWVKMGGIHYAIPKPFEIGAIATLAERGVELFTDKEMTKERFLKRVKELVLSNLNMDPTPQSVKPLIDIYANKSGFTGNPIESMGMEKLKPEYRFNANTSMVARGASTAMNKVTGLVDANGLSPMAIDYAIQGYFGWLGSLGVGISDIMLRQITGQPTKPTMDYYKFATQGMAQELPTNNSRYVTQLYDQAKIVEQAYNTYRELIKEGKVKEATEFFEGEKKHIAQYKTVEKVKAQMSVLNNQVHMIERSSIDPDLKKARIQTIKAAQNKLAQSIGSFIQ